MIEELKNHLVYNERSRVLNALDNKENKGDWCAGQQLEALKFYLFDAEIIAQVHEDDYSGSVFAIIFCENKFWLWRDSFGSCSGCDSLDGKNKEDGYQSILDTLTSVKEFETKEALLNYMDNPLDYLYYKELIIELKKIFLENERKHNSL